MIVFTVSYHIHHYPLSKMLLINNFECDKTKGQHFREVSNQIHEHNLFFGVPNTKPKNHQKLKIVKLNGQNSTKIRYYSTSYNFKFHSNGQDN